MSGSNSAGAPDSRPSGNAAGNAPRPNAAPQRPKTDETVPVGTPPLRNADTSGGGPGSKQPPSSYEGSGLDNDGRPWPLSPKAYRRAPSLPW